MSDCFKPFSRDQQFLLPPSLRDWLPEGDLAYFVIDVVDSLDLSAILRYYEVTESPAGGAPRAKAASGQPPFHPRMMVGLLLYAYCNGTPSSRKIARLCEREGEYAREVEELLMHARETDEAEDAHYGKEVRGDELPEELRFRETRLKKIREAKRALEEAAKEKARAEGKLTDEGEPRPPKRGRNPAALPGAPKPTDQRNFTDPESRIMKMGNGSFDQAYNCQAAVDSRSQIILAEEATNAPNDKEQLRSMVEQIRENLKDEPNKLSADSGYYSEGNVRYLRGKKIDDYLCPDRVKHGQATPKVRGRIPNGISFIDRVRRKLWTREGRITYALRKQIVEPVFGQMKHVRGLRQFLLRGLEKVQGEWSLWCTTHNLLKIWALARV